MELSRAIRVAIRTLRKRPAELLPFYILSLAVPAIVRVVSFAGAGILLGYFVLSGRIEAIQTEFLAIDTDPPDVEDEEAFNEWAESLEPLFELIITPTSVIVLLLTLLLTIVLGLCLYAIVTAGQLAACFGGLRDRSAAMAGIIGIRGNWISILGLFVLEFFLWIVITGIALTIVLIAAALSLVLALFVGIVAFFVWLFAGIVIRAIFAFAPVAVIVDGNGALSSLRASAGFIRAQFANAVAYYVIAIVLLMGVSVFSSILAVIGAPTITAIISILLVAPVLDLLKTTFFGSYRDAIQPIEPLDVSFTTQLRRGTRKGMSEMARFVRDTPGLHAIAVGSIVIGFVMGWVAVEPLVGEVEASIRSRIAGIIPPVAALEFFGNNWSVALSTAFSGVALAIPAIISLWFNGVVLGALTRLEVSLIELVAFVIPHGIIEIPAILIAGAVGIYLGIHTWRTWRGRASREALSAAFERSYWVLIGVGILLAIAAIIEGFVSPFYFRLFL